MDEKEQEYVIFAGVNGAGKTTYYHTFDGFPENRVNADVILQERGGNWREPLDYAYAMREAVTGYPRLASADAMRCRFAHCHGSSLFATGLRCLTTPNGMNVWRCMKRGRRYFGNHVNGICRAKFQKMVLISRLFPC